MFQEEIRQTRGVTSQWEGHWNIYEFRHFSSSPSGLSLIWRRSLWTPFSGSVTYDWLMGVMSGIICRTMPDTSRKCPKGGKVAGVIATTCCQWQIMLITLPVFILELQTVGVIPACALFHPLGIFLSVQSYTIKGAKWVSCLLCSASWRITIFRQICDKKCCSLHVRPLKGKPRWRWGVYANIV